MESGAFRGGWRVPECWLGVLCWQGARPTPLQPAAAAWGMAPFLAQGNFCFKSSGSWNSGRNSLCEGGAGFRLDLSLGVNAHICLWVWCFIFYCHPIIKWKTCISICFGAVSQSDLFFLLCSYLCHVWDLFWELSCGLRAEAEASSGL